MRGITSTLILVAVLAGLGGYIYFVDSKRPASAGAEDSSAPKTKVFSVETEKIDELKITTGGESSLLKKSADGWKMIEPTATEADPAEVISVAQAISGLEMSRTIDENPADLKEYGLAPPTVSVEFKAGNTSGSIALGEKTPTLGDMYAIKGGDKKVFLVPAFQETSFTKKPFDLRDKKILKFDRDKADSLSMVRGGGKPSGTPAGGGTPSGLPESIDLARTGSDWRVVKPAGRSDYATVEGLITRLATSNMSKLVEANATDLAKYGLDKPTTTVTIGAGSAKTVLLVGKTENDQTYAKDASRPMVFTVDSTLQGDFTRNFDDFRKKELFEFRPFSVAKLRAVLDAPAGPKIYEFEKTNGAKPTDPEVWKVTRQGVPTREVSQAAMDDMTGKLVALKIASFVDAKTKTGLDKPALVISVSYDDGKFERVRFGQVGEDNAFGAREGEAAGTIDKLAMAAAMMAIDTAVLPPPPPPPPAAPAAPSAPGNKSSDNKK
ncbi:MAG: DUF4340 domain-containing protein [Vicinamibacterales bacterium]